MMLTLNQWRHGIVNSNLQASTRLVLHTLSYYMDSATCVCNISRSKIIESTSLSRTGVLAHLNIAEKEGWISRTKSTVGSWGGNKYTANIPEELNDEPVKVVIKKEPAQVAEPVLDPPHGSVISKRVSNHWQWGTAADLKVAEYIYGCLKRIDNRAKQPNMASWSNDVRLMRVNDERTPREICEVFKWANEDSFWQSNILSPSKLREKYTALHTKMNAEAPIASGRLRKTKGNITGVVL
jgi:hypothetical protein|tara:strand:+ start:9078 stop:9794 length:717 start_codon:yes stop_codon:yes gene_type:complete